MGSVAEERVCLADPVGDGGGCGVGDVLFHHRPDPFDRVVLRAVAGSADEQESRVVGQPLFGDAAEVGAAVVADHCHDRGVGVGGQQLVEEVAEHDGDVVDRDVVVEGAGGEVDRAVDGAADVLAGGHDAVAQAGGHPAGADVGEEVEVGFVLGEHDRSGGQGGDLLADVGADGVVVGVALGDESGPGPAGVFSDASVHRAQAQRRAAQGSPDPGGGPCFRGLQQPADAVSESWAAEPGSPGSGSVR